MQKMIAIFSIIVIGISSLFLFKSFNPSKTVVSLPPGVVTSSSSSVVATEPSASSTITVEGKIVCLSHKNPGRLQSDICVLGLNASAGKFYMLDDSKNDNKDLRGAEINTQVLVIGTLAAHPDSNYQDVGIISVIKFTPIALEIAPTNQRSGIFGSVFLENRCPVVKNPPDPNCADKPYQTNLVVTTADGARDIANFSSDANGRFSVSVPVGSYLIRSADNAPKYPACRIPEAVEVSAAKFTEIKILCDTGIR